MSGNKPRLLSAAQAWVVPVAVTGAGAALALRMATREPESYLPMACIVMLLAVPAVSTALIARGLVGIHVGARGRGIVAVLSGIALLAALVAAIQAYEPALDPAPTAPQW